ncbi:ABC transporter substrate-binding protein [Bradyrhizobium manausense]|uniref:ABC transporter substrate-binding protein n=1 Tax=Bradyrhizobium manausense TaxID=989370 RepID=UPI001BA8F0DF|nr:ABC transporter substrate-binding protein [Bradyrhizobium manausense]MBR0687802.1 ABC transporter substrate-binding protein [Bradyrhizobium manausense]
MSKIARRQFLKTAATGAVGITFAGIGRQALAAGDDVIRIGWVNARSGPLSPFAEADEYILKLAETALADGVTVDGKKYGVKFILKDTQSSPPRAGQVTKDLISSDNVHLVITSSTPETVNPVADTCEAAGVPCISTVAPWEAIYFGRGAKPGQPSPFKWTYHFSFGASDFAQLYADQWSKLPTNKKVGVLLPNDADGNAIRGVMIPALEKAGFTVIDAGPYQNGAADFSAQIAKFRDAGVDIFNTFPFPPDLPVFWRQAAQKGLAKQIKIVQLAKAGLFEQEMEVLGALGHGMASGAYWHRAFPFVSPVSGIGCDALAAGFEKVSSKPWSQQVGAQMALIDVAIEALKRSANPADKAAIAKSISTLSVVTATGVVDFAKGPVPNVATTGLVGTQWVKAAAGAKFPFALNVTSNALIPAVPITASLQAYKLG